MKQWRKLTVGINYLLRGAAQLRRARLRLLPRGREKVSLDKYRTGNVAEQAAQPATPSFIFGAANEQKHETVMTQHPVKGGSNSKIVTRKGHVPWNPIRIAPKCTAQPSNRLGSSLPSPQAIRSPPVCSSLAMTVHFTKLSSLASASHIMAGAWTQGVVWVEFHSDCQCHRHVASCGCGETAESKVCLFRNPYKTKAPDM
ncbi:hypothetical protein V8E55_008901 [Tylopilus felleus]